LFLDGEHRFYFDRCVFYKHFVLAQALSTMIGIHFSEHLVKDGNPADVREFMRLVVKLL